MSRLTERDKQVISRLYQGQLAESVARESNLAVSTISKRLKSLDTSVAGIRKAFRSGISLKNLLIGLEGNDAETAPPPITDIQSLTLSALASIEKRLASIESKLGVKP